MIIRMGMVGRLKHQKGFSAAHHSVFLPMTFCLSFLFMDYDCHWLWYLWWIDCNGEGKKTATGACKQKKPS